jgi:O-antigen ligase
MGNGEVEQDSSIRGYLGLLCSVFMVGVLLVLPLYMREEYWQLGDGKYFLFRNMALVCAVIWGVMCIAWLIWEKGKEAEEQTYEWKRRKSKKKESKEQKRKELESKEQDSKEKESKRERKSAKWKFVWSVTDFFVLGYGMLCCVSYWFSGYWELALWGYEQWYMGLISQLLFVWIYFLVSRWYDGGKFALWAGQAGFFVAVLLGVLNRLKIDPIGLFRGFAQEEWEYTHLLSTLGNVNWLCGYLAVTSAFSIGGYLIVQSRVKKAILYVNSVLGLLLLCIQSSDAGLLVMGLCGVILFLFALKEEELCGRILWLALGVSVAMPVFDGLCTVLNAWVTFPWDDQSHLLVTWKGWVLAAGLLLAMIFLRKRLTFAKIKLLVLVLAATVLLWGGLAFLPKVLETLTWDYSWGSGRGGIWHLALESFRQGDIWQKLFGVGPDCFGAHIYATFPVKEYVAIEGPFANTIIANAHNEWLNQLVNIGLLGLCVYVGIFITFLIRCVKGFTKNHFLCIGIIGASLYAINATFSFQEVLNAPFLFLLIGLCENHLRNSKRSKIFTRTEIVYEVEKMENRNNR